jgi:adenylosuccinate lyase
MTFFMDQISEHQRDLTNSASQRFIADYVTGFCLAASRMSAVIRSLGADKERLMANLRGNTGIPGGIMAEPAYILLAEAGVSDAHEVIRKITLTAEKERLSFAEALSREPETLARIGDRMAALGLASSSGEVLSFFASPERYSGLSVKKAREIAAKYRKLMKQNQGD